MPNPIETMKSKRQRHPKLHRNLRRQRPRRKSRGKRRRAHLPAKERRGEVEREVDVERAGEHGASDAVQRRGIPGDLRFVDQEVRGDGAVEPLAGEDGVAF